MDYATKLENANKAKGHKFHSNSPETTALHGYKTIENIFSCFCMARLETSKAKNPVTRVRGQALNVKG